MATGAVKWYDARKGFGFVTPDLGPCDVFVHVSALRAAGIDVLMPGQRLEFELIQDGNGRPIAFGLRPRYDNMLQEEP
ncbi:cold-shock protein [Sandarakinorhabdus sp.]|uniref:cold-shock protein n=1 Tax=Sandarakinorhabdus sp. TaxID=1916663 RepID=UPI00286DD11E|nr:cold-shock protein [Sandarakinorhabdus sp.]